MNKQTINKQHTNKANYIKTNKQQQQQTTTNNIFYCSLGLVKPLCCCIFYFACLCVFNILLHLAYLWGLCDSCNYYCCFCCHCCHCCYPCHCLCYRACCYYGCHHSHCYYYCWNDNLEHIMMNSINSIVAKLRLKRREPPSHLAGLSSDLQNFVVCVFVCIC